MKNSNPNEDLVKFAVEARKRGMTYGQLQQKETIEMLKAGELQSKDKKKKGR